MQQWSACASRSPSWFLSNHYKFQLRWEKTPVASNCHFSDLRKIERHGSLVKHMTWEANSPVPSGVSFSVADKSLTTILNCFGSCMGSFQTPVLMSLSLFEQSLSIWKSEIQNQVKTAIISSLFGSKINRKFIITKDPIIMTWVPSYYMVNLLLIRREGLWFTQKETPSCCAGRRPADNCLVPASLKQEHSPGKTNMR